ncbi:MAG: arginine deiminase-related protein [Pseudomonadota bacterium]
MVRPAAFGYNVQTAATNRLQTAPASSEAGRADAAAAVREFDALATQLDAAGVAVCVVDDTPLPPKPDAVFPNNWVSFHADGTIVLYPMLTANRRSERRVDLLQAVQRQLGFVERRRVDLTHHEESGRFLEGTGSLVLDHVQRVAYACRSPRTDEALLREWAQLLDYEPLVFDAQLADGSPVYHTNVLLWIGATAAGLGSAWIAAVDRARVLARLHSAGRSVVSFDARALQGFAGNMLELKGRDGQRVLAMSASAAAALAGPELTQLRGLTDELLIASLPTIERLGGGSLRCMLAEVPRA